MTQKENMTYSSLSSEERGILALMKSIDYGRLEHLAIREGRVVRTNDSRKIQFTKLGAKSVDAVDIDSMAVKVAEENAQITKDILAGAKGPKRDAVLLNAGASLYIGGKAESFADGVKLAAEIIDSGKATETLNKLIEVSNR